VPVWRLEDAREDASPAIERGIPVRARLAEIQEHLKLIDRKIDVYRGSLAAGEADQIWAVSRTPEER